jgi:hypothetical protein
MAAVFVLRTLATVGDSSKEPSEQWKWAVLDVAYEKSS